MGISDEERQHRTGNDLADQAAKAALRLHPSHDSEAYADIQQKMSIVRKTLTLAADILPLWPRLDVKLAQRSWEENGQLPEGYDNEGELSDGPDATEADTSSSEPEEDLLDVADEEYEAADFLFEDGSIPRTDTVRQMRTPLSRVEHTGQHESAEREGAARSSTRTSAGASERVTSPPRPTRKPRRQPHKPVPSNRAHNWRFVSTSKRYECWACGHFLLCKDPKDLPDKGCSGLTPLGEARLLRLKHKPVYFECSNGQRFVVCVQCCAMSTPVSAAKSGLIGQCPERPATQRAYGKYTQ